MNKDNKMNRRRYDRIYFKFSNQKYSIENVEILGTKPKTFKVENQDSKEQKEVALVPSDHYGLYAKFNML